MRKRGFTLIELLVVIAIIAILAAMLMAALSKAKAKGREAYCLGNLKQIGVAVMLYTADWNGMYPPAIVQVTPGTWVGAFPYYPLYPYVPASSLAGYPRWTTRLDPYLKTDKVWYCPNARKYPPSGGPPAGTTMGSYAFNGPLGGGNESWQTMSLDTIVRPSDTVMGVEAQPSTSITFPPCCSPVSLGQFWYDAEWRHNGGMNVLFCDGHVKWYSNKDQHLNAVNDRMWTADGAWPSNWP